MSRGAWAFHDIKLNGLPDGDEPHHMDTPWIEFHDDGTASGDYGCTAFRVKAELRASELTLAEDAGEPPARPGPPDPYDLCTPDTDERETVTQYERQLKRFLQGPLKITKKPRTHLTNGSTRANADLELKNEHGESATVTPVSFEGFFETRYRPEDYRPRDDVMSFESSGADLYFDFRPDGVVTGKLGCNSFIAGFVFSGPHVYFHHPRLITHHTCAEYPNMKEEDMLLEHLDSHTYLYAAGREWMSLSAGYAPDSVGFRFASLPRP
ncbi:META domain-containing protein [Streptomyces chrestomyceticus]|uniref:META domain-containing protein n=1 Tax=Streptomyces chrestomyceticus TaxID=68185 RepID=UPI0036C0FA28